MGADPPRLTTTAISRRTSRKAAPQPLDEDVVPPGALAVHADGDAVLDQHAGEFRAGELAAIVSAELFIG